MPGEMNDVQRTADALTSAICDLGPVSVETVVQALGAMVLTTYRGLLIVKGCDRRGIDHALRDPSRFNRARNLRRSLGETGTRILAGHLLTLPGDFNTTDEGPREWELYIEGSGVENARIGRTTLAGWRGKRWR